jgi:RNA polymerase sigma-70 factor (ECF subfamily)
MQYSFVGIGRANASLGVAESRGCTLMMNDPTANLRLLNEGVVTEKFLDAPGEQSFADLFKTFTPQLVAFFRTRNCERTLAEDLAQEVMLIVYRKANQIRDRKQFRAWLFKIARNALCRHYGKRAREVETVNLEDVNDRFVATSNKSAGTPAFEFLHWLAFLDSRERELMRLRFVEQWEYSEIADAHSLPIGTVQWRVFNAKKKLMPYLATRQNTQAKAA